MDTDVTAPQAARSQSDRNNMALASAKSHQPALHLCMGRDPERACLLPWPEPICWSGRGKREPRRAPHHVSKGREAVQQPKLKETGWSDTALPPPQAGAVRCPLSTSFCHLFHGAHLSSLPSAPAPPRLRFICLTAPRTGLSREGREGGWPSMVSLLIASFSPQ